jgi:hypothetical protein
MNRTQVVLPWLAVIKRWAIAIARFSRYSTRYFIGLLSIVILCCSMAAPSISAQNETTLRIVSVDSSRYPLIELVVDYSTVTGQPVADEPVFTVTANGKPLTVANQSQRRLPINVAVVTDLTAHMSDQGAPSTTRFENMLPLAKDLVSQLQASINYVSLVTFTEPVGGNEVVQIPHQLTNDLQAIANTLNKGNPELIFQSSPLEGANPEAVYPLYNAIRSAIAQLVVGEKRPSALVIYAAGPIAASDIQSLGEEVALARNNGTPIQILIVSFGSPEPGTFTTFPAGTQSLNELSDSLGGTIIDLGNELFSLQTRQELDKEYKAIVQRGEHWVFTVDASAIAAGASTINVEVDGNSVEAPIEVPAIAPEFLVQSSSERWENEVTLTIKPELQQAPIVRVEYLLNNTVFGESSNADSGFAYTFSASERAFLAQFPPGTHILTAAAFDERGLQNRSREEIMVTVIEPPVTPLSLLAEYWWVAAGLVVLVAMLAGFAIYQRSSSGARSRASTDSHKAGQFKGPQPARSSNDEEPTKRYGSAPQDVKQPAGMTEPLDEDELTKRFASDPHRTQVLEEDDEKTARFSTNNNATLQLRWRVTVLEGADEQTFELTPPKRHFDIGRPVRGQRPDIAINDSLVSRSHAKLEVIGGTLELTAMETENGTFIGEDRRAVDPHQKPVPLASGDVFWLSPKIKLCVESERYSHGK